MMPSIHGAGWQTWGCPSSDQKGGILLHATSSIDFSCIEIILTYFDTQELNRHQKIPYHCLSVIRLPLVAKTFRRIRGYRLGSRINGYGYGYGYGMGERIRIRIRIQKNVSVDNSSKHLTVTLIYAIFTHTHSAMKSPQKKLNHSVRYVGHNRRARNAFSLRTAFEFCPLP